MIRMFTFWVFGAVVVMSTPASASGSKSVTAGVSQTPAVPSVPAVVVFFGMGEQVFDVGPLPEVGKAAKKKSKKRSKKKAKKRRSKAGWLYGYRAGFRCQVALVFWSYVHRWNCKPVVARDQVVLSPTSQYQTARLEALKKAIAQTYKLSDHKLSWWGLNGRFVVGGILLLLIFSGIMRRMRRRY